MMLGRSTGGIGTHVAQLSADLRDAGVDVMVVTHPLTAASFDLGPVREWWPGSAGWFRGMQDLRCLRRLARTADIVHAHGNQAALLATLTTLSIGSIRYGPAVRASRGRRRPPRPRAPKIIISQHNAVLRGSGRQALKRLAQRWVTRHADLVTGASSDLVEDALAFGAGRAELAEVPSPRVPALLSQRPADRGVRDRLRRALLSTLDVDHQRQVDPSAPLVVTISRIAPQKDLPVLVQAASRMSQTCTWVVLGDGDPRLLAQLRHDARALAAPVLFVGPCSDPSPWLRAAEVFILPSRWEARALVVQEAMAAGTPVVATDVGGLHDLVAGTGLLVIPGDPDAIAEATDGVLADPGLRSELSARGREAARALPDGRHMASRWLAWYSQTHLMT
jgi:glycosyltransferase involved in cell wall biosynthesis